MLKLIKFSAAWCGPCVRSEPMVWAVLQEFPKIKYEMIDINTTADKELLEKYNVRSVPFFVLEKEGRFCWSHVGVVTKEHLRDVLKRY